MQLYVFLREKRATKNTQIDDDKDKAINIATETINKFEKIYEKKWLNMMRDKLGLFGEDTEDLTLIMELLTHPSLTTS